MKSDHSSREWTSSGEQRPVQPDGIPFICFVSEISADAPPEIEEPHTTKSLYHSATAQRNIWAGRRTHSASMPFFLKFSDHAIDNVAYPRGIGRVLRDADQNFQLLSS